MCRFTTKNDVGYQRVKQELESFIHVIETASRGFEEFINQSPLALSITKSQK